MSWLGERIPRDVKPTIAGQELVSIGTDLQELHQMLELGRIFRSDVGSLAKQVLRVRYSTYLAIDGIIAKTGIDNDWALLFIRSPSVSLLGRWNCADMSALCYLADGVIAQ